MRVCMFVCAKICQSHALGSQKRGHRICWNCIKGVMASCEPVDMDREKGTLS